ncbi:MAG TPA: hypothetical protein VLA54_04485 [Acidimicrobiia bacterium]|nr:hypothetical protein [Acidimicrobiia bacterium]
MTAAPVTDRIHAALMNVVAIATIGYWVEYFTSGRVKSATDPAYVAFENAFPLADGYMAVCFLAAARSLRRQRASAVGWGIAAGSAFVFLGAMDTLYNLQHGKYRERTPEMALEKAINVVSLTFGPLTMWRVWRARSRLQV